MRVLRSDFILKFDKIGGQTVRDIEIESTFFFIRIQTSVGETEWVLSDAMACRNSISIEMLPWVVQISATAGIRYGDCRDPLW
jgi:hypothetical protein